MLEPRREEWGIFFEIMHFNYKGNTFHPAVPATTKTDKKKRVSKSRHWRRKCHFPQLFFGGATPLSHQPPTAKQSRDTWANSGTSLGNKNENCIRLSLPLSGTLTLRRTRTQTQRPIVGRSGPEGWSGRRQMAFHGRCRHSLVAPAIVVAVAVERLSERRTLRESRSLSANQLRNFYLLGHTEGQVWPWWLPKN